MGMAKIGLRSAILLGVGSIALAACGGGSSPGTSSSGSSGAGTKGGTLYILTLDSQFLHLDPQRNYTGEDLAFASGYITRTLNAYTFAQGQDGWKITPDLATDTGTATDNAQTWTWTLKDGAKWQDGTPVTCEDIKYGISRTFATTTITDGPSYAIQYLDIPKNKDGSSVYKGPYDKTKSNDTAAFDKAIVCDGSTITFHLNQPLVDFNSAVTLTAFAAVPKASDTGAKYDDAVQSDGPYQITSYKKNQKLVLDRNPNWDPASDSYRPAYPDTIEVDFGLDPAVIDKRIMEDQGNDQFAIMREAVQPQDLATVFNSPQYADRRWNDYDPYSLYIAINCDHIKNQKLRNAIQAAWPRATVRTIAGGQYAGDLSDGVIKSNFAGYQPTNMWNGLIGQKIGDNGDPAYAKQLIKDSGEKMPTLDYQYAQTPTNDKIVGAVVTAMAKAGITVKPDPLDPGQYYGIVFDPQKAGDLITGGWGPDWGNASTIIPPLFTPAGGWDMSQYNDPAFNTAVDNAKKMTNLTDQVAAWNQLNAQAMKLGLVVPTRWSKTQRIAGSKVGGGYIWAPYGSWPYGDMWVNQ